MKVAIFGLGYVGTVCGACFARYGHEVIGVDVNPLKVQMIAEGQSPIVEPELDTLLAEAHRQGRLRATTEAGEAVAWADVSLVCVGTPSNENGSLNLDYIYGVCRQIGEALRAKDSFHVVVIRSTVLPGTVDRCAKIIEETSAKRQATHFAVASNPEFLREGSAIHDFMNPPFTLVGTNDERARELLRELYAPVGAEFIAVEPRVAEMLKYVNNSFHALKVAFANEIGEICKSMGIDSHTVMELFMRDTKLNISPAYFRPGYAYGGSCLPKDLSALAYQAQQLDLPVPVLRNIQESNRRHIEFGIRLIQRTGKKKIGLLGLSFKEGTDDLRESPLVVLVETLLGKGYSIKIYDRNVNLAKLMGANKAYIEKQIPHISQLFVASLDDIIAESECVVIGNKDPEFAQILERLRPDQLVVDLVRIDRHRTTGGNYEGICW
ncbi:MAG: UDP-glucose/GDP-mannose dehydrogenase family protein [Candidatus Sumerlaeaceae bacterium]|nr:UDP-glucose/GDP-mannose dehydrogenase family protein [Candidatus Sumerlaeaceae bacterium]